MELQIHQQLFIVTGASSGLGKAIAEALIQEGAHIIAVARRENELQALKAMAPEQVEYLVADITDVSSLPQLMALLGGREPHGLLVNAGGPPAKTVLETTLPDWDQAYHSLLRWKVALTQAIVPLMVEKNYGRVLYLESASVKQPFENLVLSNSLRAAVVGMAKTLAQEIAKTGVTLNIIGPGSHNTPAIDRVYRKKSEQTGQPFEEVKAAAIRQIPVGALGEASDFASLAAWLLSPMSRYITGQTITVDGGVVKGV
jgi:3-oxoacyl-[acyl-carrier protein] reductase